MKERSTPFEKLRLLREIASQKLRSIKTWLSVRLRPESHQLPSEPLPMSLPSGQLAETMETDDLPSGAPLITENLALKRRVDELEAYIHELKGLLDRWGLLPSTDPAVRRRAAILLGVTLLLTSIPPAFVVLDRWFDSRVIGELTGSILREFDFPLDIALPQYMLLAVGLFLAAVIFVAVVPHERSNEFRATPIDVHPAEDEGAPLSSRLRMASLGLGIAAAIGYITFLILGIARHNVPGWGLIFVVIAYLTSQLITEVHIQKIRDFIHARGYVIFSVLLLQLSLTAFLASFYSGGNAIGVFSLLLILSLLNIYLHRHRISPMIWVISLAVILYTMRINSWIFSTIGDEYSFYTFGRYIAEDQGLLEIGSRLFDGRAVYGTHPYFSSVIQAISMWLLGSENFGWRFSSPYLAALSIPFFYAFLKGFLSKRIALIMTILMAVSHYLINFGKIGYNNLQALFVMSVVLWVTGKAIRDRRPLIFIGLGMAIAVCFYVYPAALYVLPLPILLLLFYLPPFSRPSIRLWIYMVAGFMLLFLPLLFQQDYWQAKVAGTLFFTPEIASSAKSLLQHFGTNLLYTVLSYVYTVAETHFVVSSYLDPVTAIFLPIGLALTLRSVRKSRFAIFVLIAFILECFLVGATHDRPFPPTTRMFLLLPWFTIFASLGISWAVEQAQRISFQPIPASSLIGFLLIVILGANLYQANVLFPKRTEGAPNLEVLFLRLLQYDQQADPQREKVYLFITESNWGIDGLRTMQDVYKLPESQAQLVRAEVSDSNLPQWAISRILEENTMVILQPWMNQEVKQQIEAFLMELGKAYCVVRNTPTSSPRFTLWHSPGYEDLCENARMTW